MAKPGFILTSPSLDGYDVMPIEQTCDGAAIPPSFEWSHAPRGTRSFVMVMEDLDGSGGPACHWLVWDIPGEPETRDPVQIERLGVVGKNDFQANDYRGPCPPRKAGEHRYRFLFYALDVATLPISPAARRPEVERAISGHVLETAELTGRYARGPVLPNHERRLRYRR